jgi:hypothetical protein
VNDDKVRMPVARTHRKVVPDDSVLFEEVLEALRESQLAAGVEAREAQAGNQDCHVTAARLTASSELNVTSTRFGPMLTGLPLRKSIVLPATLSGRPIWTGATSTPVRRRPEARWRSLGESNPCFSLERAAS